jgi:hypothetical protein
MIRPVTRAARRVAAVAALFAVAAPAATASSTPVGPLPKSPVTSLSTKPGSLFSIAVPSKARPTGLVWRIARPFQGRVVRQVGEGEISGTTVLVFKAVGKGKTSIVLALTKGDASPKALAAVRYSVTAR